MVSRLFRNCSQSSTLPFFQWINNVSDSRFVFLSVAVCGLPHPNKNHALTMARFAKECLLQMQKQLSQLETSLGEDTSKLGMRFGLHTGPVTAGVLRGELTFWFVLMLYFLDIAYF